jgi:hypothetical protein
MSTIDTEEKAYMATSLDFINNHKANFTPVLSDIASKMNDDNELMNAMNAMKESTNSNLKELITILIPFYNNGNIAGFKKNGVIDYSMLVTTTLKFIVSTDNKDKIHELLINFKQDMEKHDTLVNKLKRSTEWKKMVGMLIPEGASVKLNTQVLQRNTSDWNLFSKDIRRQITSRDIICTVLKRDLEKRKKQLILPKEILFRKNTPNVDVPPESIELYEQKAETSAKGALELAERAPVVPALPEMAPELAAGSGSPVEEASPEEASPEQVKLEDQGGGQQRITRKHKNSIISSARKTRTNR